MNRLGSLLLGIAVVPSLGCAARGQNFSRPSDESFNLGKTTFHEVAAAFGTPFREGTLLRNGRSLRTVLYTYTSFERSHLPEVKPARAIHFCFLDGVVMGYDFASSFEEDHTDFDEKKVLEIKEGTTTQQEVLEFLGAPNGRQIYPMTEMKDEVAFLYSYGHWKPGSGQYRKNVVVSIAPDGIVRKVSFSSSGIR